MLTIRDLYKSFHRSQVLRGVDLDVAKGDVVAIIGPSGAGKTTLLRCINFLERADRGQMHFDSIHLDMHKASAKDMLAVRKRTAFVFQNYNLFNNMTALENVTEGLIIGRQMPTREAEDRARRALDKVGLTNRLDYYPSKLSGGQQQRVGIARAIAVDPELILFDEPTSALDPELIGEVLGIMRQLALEGTTMVVVTHELAFASDAANRVVFMDHGLVVESGTPGQVLSSPTEERTQQFLGRILPGGASPA
ncbi:MAG TPA: amino acid ABC transporter ATP-binding protein [Spirochaetales bacterium]|nr:amino acid ABC transporter ATP-binding protein [Spirochaetales bacterium]